MSTIRDQLGHKIILRESPRRIISLVPSQTELLVDLGVQDHLVGVTKFCVHPDEVRKVCKIVGGTKKFNFELIDTLQPDLIIANKEENYQEGVERLQKNYPVWTSDIFNLSDALKMISSVGAMIDKSVQATTLTKEIKSAFKQLRPLGKEIRVAYAIWKDPWMVVGSNTFIDEMLKACGFVNVFANSPRYPQTTLEEIKNKQPDVVFLSSEPYPFQQKHVNGLKKEGFNIKTLCVDGEMFSWYGSRLKHAPGYFEQVINQL